MRSAWAVLPKSTIRKKQSTCETLFTFAFFAFWEGGYVAVYVKHCLKQWINRALLLDCCMYAILVAVSQGKLVLSQAARFKLVNT